MQFVEGEASPMGLAEPSEIAAGKIQAVSAVGHVENGGESQCPKQGPETFDCYLKVTMKWRLPKGLIGTKCTAQVCFEGMKVNCLLDTGSQVSTIK